MALPLDDENIAPKLRPCSIFTYHEIISDDTWIGSHSKEWNKQKGVSLESYMEQLENLYNHLPNTRKHVFVFMGPMPDDILEITRSLSDTLMYETLKEPEFDRLDDFLSYLPNRPEEKDKRKIEILLGDLADVYSLTFLPFYTSPTDTVQYIKKEIANSVSSTLKYQIPDETICLIHKKNISRSEYSIYVDRWENNLRKYYKGEPKWDQILMILKQLGVSEGLLSQFRKVTRMDRRKREENPLTFRECVEHPNLQPVIHWMMEH